MIWAELHFIASACLQLCEETLKTRTTAEHVKTPEQKTAEQFRLYVQQQAAAGGVPGVAGAWEGEISRLPPAPR